MADHQDLDIPAIGARMKRLNPEDAILAHDVDLLIEELAYVQGEMAALQQNLTGIIDQLGRALDGIIEQLGRMQRGGTPDDHDHRPMA